jgi:uncharacterized membrane protein
MTPEGASRAAGAAKATAVINLLIGIWVFVSPWVYGASLNPDAWNSWVVGALIVIFAAIRIGSPAGGRGVAWINTVLGAWLFISPWLFGYTTNGGRFINSLIAGAAVFIISIVGANAGPHRIIGTAGTAR